MYKMIRSKLFSLLILLFLFGDSYYSFLQFYSTPIDGDMAGGIVPAEDVKPIFEDPFGFQMLSNGKQHPNPNRYFSHLIHKEYFRTVPNILQLVFKPIDSVYYACALIKIIIHLLLIHYLALIINSISLPFKHNYFIAILLVFPLIQSYGYNHYMGIINQSTTYCFFYSLPILLLLIYSYTLFKQYTLKNNNLFRNLTLVCLTIILPFSGPLIPPLILILTTLFFSYKLINKNFPSNIKSVIIYVFIVNIMSIYSLYIGTYNSTFLSESIPILERYARLPLGIYYISTQKLGIPLLLLAILLNTYLIKKRYSNDRTKAIISFLKWIGIFTLVYLILLPMGGYRPYRPFLLKSDTFTPITIALIIYFGLSTIFLINRIKNKFYYIFISAILLAFTGSDISKLNENSCEKKNLIKISKSKSNIVELDNNCNVMSWNKITAPQDSKLNSELLYILNITDKKKLYFNSK